MSRRVERRRVTEDTSLGETSIERTRALKQSLQKRSYCKSISCIRLCFLKVITTHNSLRARKAFVAASNVTTGIDVGAASVIVSFIDVESIDVT